MICRNCSSQLTNLFLDLDTAPPSNNILKKNELKKSELFYPLRVFVCKKCFLLQTEDFVSVEDLFDELYPYFSSTSTSWVEHAKKYVDKMIKEFNLNKKSLVLEVAANDGYLLQFFNKKKIPNFGIEPTKSTSKKAKEKNIDIIEEFFNTNLAKKLKKNKGKVDLLIANNVLAHVPNLNDFLKGVEIILHEKGIATFEFPYVKNLIDKVQFDTIYHEHFSYFSFTSVNNVLNRNNLYVFDVEQIKTHGGSLRIYVQNKKGINSLTGNVRKFLSDEKKAGYTNINFYKKFQPKVNKIKYRFLKFLIKNKLENKKIVAYGAAAKGNTLLNYCGIRSDLIDFIVDKNSYKQNKFTPGSRILIKDVSSISTYKPDIIIILPWNLSKEISNELKFIKKWNAKLYTIIPEVKRINY